MATLTKWTVDDYHRMIEAGILQGRQVELLAGVVVDMSPEAPIHYNTAKRSSRRLQKLFENFADVRFNGLITLPNDSEPEPDIAIVRLPESLYDDRHPGPEDIFLVIEFAKSSLKKDTEEKPIIYGVAGIPDYWVVDLAKRELTVFRDPFDQGYRAKFSQIFGAITPVAFPEIQISLGQLLG
jgi:Uma2 family endonuclease